MGRRVLLGGHAIASGRVVFDISPVLDEEGIAPFLHKKGIEVRVPTLTGHCSSYRDLAVVRGEQWVEQLKQEIETLLQDDEIEEYYFVGFSMGGLPLMIVLLELIGEGKYTEQLQRAKLMFVNTPVDLNGVPTKLLKALSKFPRMLLERIWLSNVPRPEEPNHEYLEQALVSKKLPISTVIEMMKLIWRLQHMQSSHPIDLSTKVKELVLVQAEADNVVDSLSVFLLQQMIGGRVVTIKDATHGFPEEEPWLSLRSEIDQFTN